MGAACCGAAEPPRDGECSPAPPRPSRLQAADWGSAPSFDPSVGPSSLPSSQAGADAGQPPALFCVRALRLQREADSVTQCWSLRLLEQAATSAEDASAAAAPPPRAAYDTAAAAPAPAAEPAPALAAAQYTDESPGTYVIVQDVCAVERECARGTPEVGEFGLGKRVSVVEVVRREDCARVRARVTDPPGWISIVALDQTGYRWAAREGSAAYEEWRAQAPPAPTTPAKPPSSGLPPSVGGSSAMRRPPLAPGSFDRSGRGSSEAPHSARPPLSPDIAPQTVIPEVGDGRPQNVHIARTAEHPQSKRTYFVLCFDMRGEPRSVNRYYSDFLQLRGRVPPRKAPFPAKTRLRACKGAALDDRRQKLAAWMQEVCRKNWPHVEVSNFLRVAGSHGAMPSPDRYNMSPTSPGGSGAPGSVGRFESSRGRSSTQSPTLPVSNSPGPRAASSPPRGRASWSKEPEPSGMGLSMVDVTDRSPAKAKESLQDAFAPRSPEHSSGRHPVPARAGSGSRPPQRATSADSGRERRRPRGSQSTQPLAEVL